MEDLVEYVAKYRLIVFDGEGNTRRSRNARATREEIEVPFYASPREVQGAVEKQKKEFMPSLTRELMSYGCLQDNIRHRIKFIGYRRA